jgi:hypothetical protein
MNVYGLNNVHFFQGDGTFEGSGGEFVSNYSFKMNVIFII